MIINANIIIRYNSLMSKITQVTYSVRRRRIVAYGIVTDSE
jgi:hypothetical protein